ncbi:hypothetical protein BJV77DRAFT_1052539 [Russula vinacea]|nr:hypothetical protein BJV77DRAFT_1052539 [Russula vinacea]
MFRGHNTARESGCNSSCHTKFRRRMDQLMDPTRSHPSTPRHAPLHAPLKHWTKECRPIINHSGISDRSREQHEANLSPVGVYKLTPITAALGPDSAPFHNHTHSAALHICIDIMFEIDWTTEEDLARRRPKASTIHGWLRMWRGTFAGNERVRQQGRYEMKVARALRAHDAKKSQAAGGNSGPLSLFRIGSNRRNAKSIPSNPRPMPTKRKSGSSGGANKGQHYTRHGHSSHARPEATHHHRSHSAKSRTRPSRQSSGRR